jgi:bifunctional non-homologous end joining protein LigD
VTTKRLDESSANGPAEAQVSKKSNATARFGRYTVELTKLDKVLFPDARITKGEIIDYYREVADRMLPYLQDRPVSMQRFPDGIGGEGFYQKEIPDYFPDWIDRVTVAKAGGKVTHVVCQNAATLVYLANQACITPHVWLSRRDRLDHPDRMIFDLDPPGDDFASVRGAARTLRELLDGLGLTAYAMTTGGRGLHVVVPLDRSADFNEARGFARDAADLVARRDPERLTTETRKDKRKGRLFVDYLRNAYAQTGVPPYSVRARKGAPVAVPLAWKELGDAKLRGNAYDVRNALRRLSRVDDPWKGMTRRARSLGSPRKKLDRLLEEEES